MFEVILYAAIATIICVLLYSVLGKDVGQGPDKTFNVEELMQKNKPDTNTLHSLTQRFS